MVALSYSAPSISSGGLFSIKVQAHGVPLTAQPRPDPRRYFEAVGDARGQIAEQEPVCLYIETTNRCNLLCETCPRTFEDLEPPADMSWQLFTRIVDQFPRIGRVVLHGVGEPMMVKALPRMVRYLKDRGTYVLFNTNGTLLTMRKGRELIAAGLDELRVSLDAAEPSAFLAVRGKDMFDRIVRNVGAFTAHGRAIPCCIAPFSMRGYDGFTLGNATQESLRQIWNGPRYREFRRALLSETPPPACTSCGVRWSL